MTLKFAISPRKIGMVLGFISCFLAIVSLITEYVVEVILVNEFDSVLALILDLFSVNLEESIPTWFSVLILFFAALVLAIIAINKFRTQTPYSLHWIGLAFLFLFFSMDEGAGIHEILANLLQNSLRLGGFFYFGWQVVAIPLVIIFAFAYLRFVLHLPNHIRNLFILGAIFYVGGALIIEGISANQWYVDNGMTMTYLAIATVEELFEMLGVVVFIHALLTYIVESDIVISFHSESLKQIENHDETAIIDDKLDNPLASNPQLLKVNPSLLIIIFLIVTNFALFAWVINQNQQRFSNLEPFYAPMSDQLNENDVLISEMNSAFTTDDTDTLHFIASLFSQYEAITIVSFPSENHSIIFAGNALPFNRNLLTDLLHKNGEVEFVIFETSLLKAVSS